MAFWLAIPETSESYPNIVADKAPQDPVEMYLKGKKKEKPSKLKNSHEQSFGSKGQSEINLQGLLDHTRESCIPRQKVGGLTTPCLPKMTRSRILPAFVFLT